jgi:hypothetical protein
MTSNPLDSRPRLAVAVWAIGTLTSVAVAVGATHALAATGHEAVRFDRVSSTHPTLVDRVVVRGDGCFTAEDMTRLRLVSWAPERETVVYRCVKP